MSRIGVPPVRVRMSVEEMLRLLKEAGLRNTGANRAAMVMRAGLEAMAVK